MIFAMVLPRHGCAMVYCGVSLIGDTAEYSGGIFARLVGG